MVPSLSQAEREPSNPLVLGYYLACHALDERRSRGSDFGKCAESIKDDLNHIIMQKVENEKCQKIGHVRS